MKKLLTSLFAVLFSVSLFAVNIPAGTKLYLTPSVDWKTNNARFVAYFYQEGTENNLWADMVATGITDLYKVSTPEGTWDHVIFVRMNPSNPENNWENKWNQTGNLTYDGTNNHYTMIASEGWNNEGEWVTYSHEPITIKTKIPEDWETVSFYYWTTTSAASFVTPTQEGNWYSYTFNDVECINLIFVSGSDWASDEDAGTRLGKQTVNIEGITSSTCYKVIGATYEEGDANWGKRRVSTIDCAATNITIKTKIPADWETVSFYYWTIGDGSFATPVHEGDWYSYTFEDFSSINLIFVGGSGWPADEDDATKKGKQSINIEGITESTCYEIIGATYEDGDWDWGKRRVNVADCTLTALPAIKCNNDVIVENNVIRASFEGTAKIELYTIGGQLIRSVT
ncbi:MAG: hypothetical protein LBG77_06635, partial [Dysgonamonadaceae bacterium]|nr:hypothetical protein [Dysgonamonadaceae bacterium]